MSHQVATVCGESLLIWYFLCRKEKDVMHMRRVQQKHFMQLGTKANRLQKHWRDPTLMF